jgi:hypothetical protein
MAVIAVSADLGKATAKAGCLALSRMCRSGISKDIVPTRSMLTTARQMEEVGVVWR